MNKYLNKSREINKTPNDLTEKLRLKTLNSQKTRETLKPISIVRENKNQTNE